MTSDLRAITLQSFKIRIGFIKHILSYSKSKLRDIIRKENKKNLCFDSQFN
jgi:hypothetical protein